jgi:predicted nucleic acid-binding protein
VFVDTSGFYALLDSTDPANAETAALFQRAAGENWHLHTTNYVVLETTALIQSRLGWTAVEQWINRVLVHCNVTWIDQNLHQRGEARWAHARERRLSLTDCVSFEFMRKEQIKTAIAHDEHFDRNGFKKP